MGPSGQTWVVNRLGDLYVKETADGQWKKIKASKAIDVGAGPEGSVFITGVDGGVFKLGKNGKFWNLGGDARQIAVGKGGRPFIVNEE